MKRRMQTDNDRFCKREWLALRYIIIAILTCLPSEVALEVEVNWNLVHEFRDWEKWHF